MKIASASADFNQSGWTIDHALDRNEKTAWGIHPKVGESHHAVFKLKEPLTCGEDAKLTFILKQLHGEGHVIGRLRLSATSEKSPAMTTALPAGLERILASPKTNRTEDEQAALAKFVVNRRITDELAALPKPSMVYAAASDFESDGSHKPAGAPRAVHVLKRGDINKPQAAAAPGALSCVASLQAKFEIGEEKNEGLRRAALAKWLTEPGEFADVALDRESRRGTITSGADSWRHRMILARWAALLRIRNCWTGWRFGSATMRRDH